MIRTVLILVAIVHASLCGVQGQSPDGVLHSGQKTGQSAFPVVEYSELPNPVAANPKWWEGQHGTRVSWGSTDIRYKKERPMPIDEYRANINLYAWKGERVSAQWVATAYDASVTLSYTVSELIHDKDKSKKISNEQIFTGFVRYVMTDELNKDGQGTCGHRNNANFDSTLVADAIDHLATTLTIPAHSTRAGWIRIWIPGTADPGIYHGTVTVRGDGQILEELEIDVNVIDQRLPEPDAWKFHLDLWQNPYAVARYYQVEPWSKAHFEKMQVEMMHYANAGGDVITASITHKPWNGQTHDYFETMVTWMKKADGTWYFDYTIFDQWVEFMLGMGVNKQINCYSMIPWRLSFQFYDQATNQLKFIETKPGEQVYEELWVAMLSSFASHLKEKGWFEKTYIAMDERPMEAMIETLKVIRKADKNFKISLAGNLHPELIKDIDDYCISYGQTFTSEMKKMRRTAGQISTYYTSCSHPYPNTFTFSPPAQSEWLAWYAASHSLDGFLRWAYNSWVSEPLLDSRFITWAAGDTYFVYPGGRTSIRFERLVEGIQQYEKIKILKKQLSAKGDREELQKLERILAGFDHLDPNNQSAASQIQAADKFLRKL